MKFPPVIGALFRFDLDSEKRSNFGCVIAVGYNDGRPTVNDRPGARPQFIGECSGCRRRVALPDNQFLFPTVQEPQRVLFDRDSSGLKYSLIVDAIEQGYYKIA